MNQTQAQARCNPQAVEYEPKVSSGNWQKGASYDEALGFISSCHGVSCLAHYCLMPGGDTVSRRECAREIAKTLGIVSADLIELEIECWVNRSVSYEDVGLSDSEARRVIKHMRKDREPIPHINRTDRQKYLAELYLFIDGLKPNVIELLPFIGKAGEIREPVSSLLMEWENEWMRKLGGVDDDC